MYSKHIMYFTLWLYVCQNTEEENTQGSEFISALVKENHKHFRYVLISTLTHGKDCIEVSTRAWTGVESWEPEAYIWNYVSEEMFYLAWLDQKIHMEETEDKKYTYRIFYIHNILKAVTIPEFETFIHYLSISPSIREKKKQNTWVFFIVSTCTSC